MSNTENPERLCSDQKYKKKYLQDQDRKYSLDLNQVLNFVESKNRKQSQSMKTAFNIAKDNGMNPIWITVDQALNLCKETKNHVFIIESFKTDLFDKLFSNKCCLIYGPSCFFYCKNQFNLPRRRFPMFNLCMRNLDICIEDDEFSEDEICQFFGLIKLMCGTFNFALRPTTTHLISNSFSTTNSKLARAYGIPIMNKDWIQQSWETSLSKDINADDKQFMDKFRLPIFKNFRINMSQVKIERQFCVRIDGFI